MKIASGLIISKSDQAHREIFGRQKKVDSADIMSSALHWPETFPKSHPKIKSIYCL